MNQNVIKKKMFGTEIKKEMHTHNIDRYNN